MGTRASPCAITKPARNVPPSWSTCCASGPSSGWSICGLATDYCVKATALDAVRLGFGVSLLGEAVAAVNLDPDDGDRALLEMAEAGVTSS